MHSKYKNVKDTVLSKAKCSAFVIKSQTFSFSFVKHRSALPTTKYDVKLNMERVRKRKQRKKEKETEVKGGGYRNTSNS
jgi:hypothetical protein